VDKVMKFGKGAADNELERFGVAVDMDVVSIQKVTFKDKWVAELVAVVIRNVVSNAARYSDDQISEYERIMWSRGEVLTDGSVLLRFRDRGVGIEDLDRLGHYGYREGRKKVKGSQGEGIYSMITSLSRLGIPLFVKSELGEGTEFAFRIPKAHLEGDPSEKLDIEAFYRGLLDEGFVVPAASMSEAVREVIENVRSIRYVEDYRHQYPGMELVMRLLAGSKGPEASFVVENGPDQNSMPAIALLSMGFAVLLKDPIPLVPYSLADRYDDLVRGVVVPDDMPAEAYIMEMVEDRKRDWMDRIVGEIPESVVQNVGFAPDSESVNIDTPADVVLWTNPYIVGEIPDGMTLEEYMGRDVKKGKYLVVQADIETYHNLIMDPKKWESVYYGDISNSPLGSYLIPTRLVKDPHIVQIWRRK